MHISALKVRLVHSAVAILASSTPMSQLAHLVTLFLKNDMRQERANMRKRIRELEGHLLDAQVHNS